MGVDWERRNDPSRRAGSRRDGVAPPLTRRAEPAKVPTFTRTPKRTKEAYRMAPLTLERFVQELEKLKQDKDAGNLRPSEYDQRLARTIRQPPHLKLPAHPPPLPPPLS